jgi:putative PEP-CTERM system TPR-repeat lipoprotein
MKKSRTIVSSTMSTAIVLALIAGCGGENPEKLVASGKAFIEKNDNKAGIIQLKNALQSNPNLGEARFLLGKALLDTGDATGAEVELRKAIELKYAADQAIPLLAKAMVATGQHKKLIDEFGKTELSTKEATANLKTILSFAYAAQGNREAGQNALAAALAAQPDYAPALLADARKKAEEKKLDEAQKIVDSVLAKNPKDPEALLFNGVLQSVANNPDKALALFRQAIEVKPDFIAAHSVIISHLFQQQKLEEADKQIEAMKKIAPKNPQTIYLEAQQAYQHKNFKVAKELVQQLLKVSSSPNTLQLAGAIEYQLRSYLQAETYLTKALQQTPELPLARQVLISTYLRAGQPAKALSTLQPAFGRFEQDPIMLTLAGETYLQNNDASKAAEYFAKASKLDPENANKKTSLALAHLAQGNTSSAFDELEKISQADKGITADLALVAAYQKNNQLDKALKAIDSLEKKQPDNAAIYNLRAQTLLAKKDLQGARQSYEKSLSINPGFFPAAAGLATLDINENKPAEAAKRFEAILANDPKNTQALLALAEMRTNNGGSTEEVAGLLNKAITATPTEVAPRVALIQFYMRAKDAKKALAVANDAVAAFPEKPEILDVLGQVQQNSGDLNQALVTYGKLAAQQPASPLAQVRIAEIHLANKNKDEAAKYLKKALEIKPDYVQAQRHLISLALSDNKLDTALDIAHQIQKQRPNEGVGYVFEGDIQAGKKAWPEALAAYRTGLKQAPISELAIKLYTTLLASGNAGEAEKVATTWLKDHPKDITFRIMRGDLATAKKDYPLAAQYYRSALDIQPNNQFVLNNLAWVAGQLKDPKAIEYAERANQLAPNQPPFMDTLAMLMAEKGETAKAIELMRKAMGIAPQASVVQLNLAKLLIKAGKKEEARKELDALAKLGEKFPAQAEVTKLQQSL